MTKENNGWISIRDLYPEVFEHKGFMRSDVVLGFGKESKDETVPTYIFVYMIKGNRFYSENGECYEITHWQPLPPRPSLTKAA